MPTTTSASSPSAIHRGEDELPFVPVGDGSHLQLLRVDAGQGYWVARQRFEPGTVLPRHIHTGPVHVFTLAGRWNYLEYPETNTAGSFLYEPAGSTHTFNVPEDNDRMTDIWYSISGSNLNVDAEGTIVSVDDGPSVLRFYRRACQKAGFPRPPVVEQ